MKRTTNPMSDSEAWRRFCVLVGLAALIGLLFGLSLGRAYAAPGDGPQVPESVTSPDVEQVNGSFEYVRIPGSAFQPFSTAAAYAYPGAGCINRSGGTEARFAHKLVLPAGSVVKYLRLYYFDNSTSEVQAFFTTYDAAGNFTELATVASTDDGTYGSALSPALTYTIDPASSPVNIVINIGTQNDSTLRFCGVRVAYIPVVTDRIFADDFDFIPL